MNEYLLLQLDIRCGDYEFTSVSVHQIPAGTDIVDFSENYAKEFYFRYGRR